MTLKFCINSVPYNLRPNAYFRSGFIHSHPSWPHSLSLWDSQSDWQGLLWTSSEGLRPQNSYACRAENGEKREEVSQTGAGGDQNIGTSEETRQRQQLQHHPHAGQLHLQVGGPRHPSASHTNNVSFQESHLHNFWAFINQFVRVDKEEQVPRILAAAREKVCP